MEYIESPNLMDRITKEKKITEEEAKNILKGTLSALAHIHSSLDDKILHRDIKPSNILYDGDKAYLFDFNFSKIGEATRASRYIENLYYPIDVFSGKQTQSQDLVALGNVIISVAFGMEIESVRRMQGKEVMSSLAVEGLPYSAKLKNFLRKLTANNPALRYQEAGQALEVLENLEATTEDVLDSNLSLIIRNKSMNELLLTLKKEDELFDYNVPASLRTTLDDDTLLVHLERTYAQKEFIIDDPKEVKNYIKNYGDMVIKKGRKVIEDLIVKKDQTGYVINPSVDGNSDKVQVRFENHTKILSVFDLIIVGMNRKLFPNRIINNVKADMIVGGIKKNHIVRYTGETISKELYVIPDGAIGVVSMCNNNYTRGKQEEELVKSSGESIDVVWVNQPDLNQARIHHNHYTVNSTVGELLLRYHEIKLVRKNFIDFSKLYNSCFKTEK